MNTRDDNIELESLKSNEDNIASQNSSKKRKRTKADETQKNFICECGKSYMSYAALYTHTKNKHDGIFPEGTVTQSKKKARKTKKMQNR